MDPTFGGAVLAGLLSFFSPCVLPMVPFYLAYLGGLSVRDLGRAEGGARARLVARTAIFAAGVTTIFVLLGLGATAIGGVFARWQGPLSWAAAAVLMIFGLQALGVVRIPALFRQAQIQTSRVPTSPLGAYVMGLAFGFGWTPCVGPALAAILMLASAQGDAWRGGLLLLAYGVAMTLPFVVAAAFAGPFLARLARHRGAVVWAERAMGVMLVLFAVLIASGSMNRIAAAMTGWFDWTPVLR
jgi:cytochrome c-type biogenesis protein